MTAPTNALLSRLDKVQRIGRGRWKACCPAHDDKSPSLSIRELDDGRVLLHCFGGCPVENVLSSLGLDFSDLMPAGGWLEGRPKERRPFYAADVLKIMRDEALLVHICASDISNGKRLSDADRGRLLLAAQRLRDAVEVANGY